VPQAGAVPEAADDCAGLVLVAGRALKAGAAQTLTFDPSRFSQVAGGTGGVVELIPNPSLCGPPDDHAAAPSASAATRYWIGARYGIAAVRPSATAWL
jgi:hypothetical protein